MKKIISASILSADFLRLEKEIKRVEESGCSMLHFDVMDGIFVKNISFGFPLLEAVKRCTSVCLDVHLMITSPLKYAAGFAKAGADIITFHLESEDSAEDVINEIKRNGKKVGLALKPSTPFEKATPYLKNIDMLLIMTVEPGFGGQTYISEMTEKIRQAKEYIQKNKLNILIQVDGGINNVSALEASQAGADVLVAGNYLFKADSMKSAVALLSL